CTVYRTPNRRSVQYVERFYYTRGGARRQTVERKKAGDFPPQPGRDAVSRKNAGAGRPDWASKARRPWKTKLRAGSRRGGADKVAKTCREHRRRRRIHYAFWTPLPVGPGSRAIIWAGGIVFGRGARGVQGGRRDHPLLPAVRPPGAEQRRRQPATGAPAG